ncbi:uncharacterized protein BT62DRAFT_237985 [Guyanagaster necrorhizus]|uniref:Uncharacterized protein n=1 Tax=Guyanagaster necrorhizus TaxID=856835 RepID=A0A9P7VQW8_9AGAR|nr:uncharacterized protein BT62DRAFT_237985 [Guyanagaster necrorhizus MCA 3950]KAG7444356.1 hypothetical protein BT62DRAFT_237985 [Guyanagaster necrorhizus MCA 3950]
MFKRVRLRPLGEPLSSSSSKASPSPSASPSPLSSRPWGSSFSSRTRLFPLLCFASSAFTLDTFSAFTAFSVLAFIAVLASFTQTLLNDALG